MANPRDHVENHLTPFTPSPTKLTDSFGKFADKGLKKGGAFDVVVKEAGDGIGWLADELGTPTGREHFLTFVKDSAIAAVLIEGVIKSAPFAALLAMGGSALALGGMAGFGLGAFLNDPGKALGGSGWDAFNRLFDNGPQLVPTLNCRQIIHAASALSRLVRAWLIWERISAPAAFHL